MLTGAGGTEGGRVAGVRDILIYDKWLLVKLPVCSKYGIINSTRSTTQYSFGGWNILLESAAPLSADLGPTYISDLASSRLALHSPLRSSETLASRKAHHSGRSYFRCSSHHSMASFRGLQYRITNMLMTLSYTLPLTKPQPRAHLPP